MARTTIFLLLSLTAAAVTFATPSKPYVATSNGKLHVIYAPRPDVPAEAKAKHLKGAGICVVSVRADGTVSNAEMVQSTGHKILDKASTDAFSKWRFIPGSVTKVRIPITYTGDYTKS
jgi:TonB family protein